MSSESADIKKALEKGQQAIKDNWGWFLALGIVFVILGMIALAAPQITSLAAEIFLGWLFVVAGLAQGLHAFRAKNWKGFFLQILSALLSLILGIVLLAFPMQGVLSVTLLVGAFFLVDGLFRCITAFQVRPTEGWGWMLFSGALSIVLGFLIWSEWPSSAAWVLGLLVGIQLIFGGWSMVALALAGRKA